MDAIVEFKELVKFYCTESGWAIFYAFGSFLLLRYMQNMNDIMVKGRKCFL